MVADIKIADLERIKDPDRNIATVRALRAWIEAGKPAAEPPRSPKGDPIRKIRLAAKSKVNILLNTGNPNRPAAVDRGDMARVDVFRKPSAKGVFQYFLVPIYRKRCLSPIPMEFQEQLAIHCDKALQVFGAKLCEGLVRRSDA